MMVTDYGAANNKLKGIAIRLNYTLPAQLNEDHQEMVNKLQKLSGANFNKEYVSMMVKDKAKGINRF